MVSAEFLGIHMTWNSVKQLNDLCSNSFSSFAPILHLNLTTNEEILKHNIELFWCKGEKQKKKKPILQPALLLENWFLSYFSLALCFSLDWKFQSKAQAFLLICKEFCSSLDITRHHYSSQMPSQGSFPFLLTHGSYPESHHLYFMLPRYNSGNKASYI